MENKVGVRIKSTITGFIATTLFGITTAVAFNNTLTVTNIAELQTLIVPGLISSGYTNPTVFVRGYYDPGDRGGGMFQWDQASTSTPDGGRYITTNGWVSAPGRWVRLLNGETANVRMWGARGNWQSWADPGGVYAHDDTTNIQNALNACKGGLDPGSYAFWTSELLFPAGWYKVTDTLIWWGGAIKLRAEMGPFTTELIMPYGIQKDIMRTIKADIFLKGQTNSDPTDGQVLMENLSFRFYGWETNQIANPTNSCLVISYPQEGNAIHNVTTSGGAFGIRCFGGGNGAPYALRDVVTSYASVAGISVEPLPGQSVCFGHMSFTGITGDCFTTNSSLVRFLNCLGAIVIDDLNAEGTFGGGVIQHKFPDSIPNSWGIATPKGVLTIRNSQFNGTSGSSDFLVLKGGARTPSVSIQALDAYTSGLLIRDEVVGRNVPADIAVYNGLEQTAARLQVNYESSNDGSTYTHSGKRSRLVIGQTAVYSFIPTNTGWYRIMAPVGGGLISGRLTLRSYYREGAEFEVNVNPDGQTSDTPWINVLRSSKNNPSSPPLVTKARAFYYWAGSEGYGGYWSGVDVYVANVITSAYRDIEKRLIFTLPLDGFDNGSHQLLAPIIPVSTGSGDTDGLPSGATSVVVSVVR
jgi:hypothetical protein